MSDVLNDEAVREADGTLSLHKLLKLIVEKGATDLHVKVGSPPGLRPIGTYRGL